MEDGVMASCIQQLWNKTSRILLNPSKLTNKFGILTALKLVFC